MESPPPSGFPTDVCDLVSELKACGQESKSVKSSLEHSEWTEDLVFLQSNDLFCVFAAESHSCGSSLISGTF